MIKLILVLSINILIMLSTHAQNLSNIVNKSKKNYKISATIKEYNFSVFDPHLRSNKFILSVEYFGESKASKKVSDDPKSRNSIYGIEAMLERKIEIIEIICE